MGQIEQLVKSKLLGNDNPNNLVWPITKTQAVYDKTNTDLQTVLDSLGSEIQEIKEINNVSVRYDQVQELTEEQKETARENIDAGTYSKPEGGIPASDLADDVYESFELPLKRGTGAESVVQTPYAMSHGGMAPPLRLTGEANATTYSATCVAPDYTQWYGVGTAVILLSNFKQAIITAITADTVTFDRTLSKTGLNNEEARYAELYSNQALGRNSTALGAGTKTGTGTGPTNVDIDRYTGEAKGIGAFATGIQTQAKEHASVAEGIGTFSSGYASHAEGNKTKASGDDAHAEGYQTQATGDESHAEGMGTQARGTASHAEGNNTQATGMFSHAEGHNTIAEGNFSHASGEGTVAYNDAETAIGSYNKSNNSAGDWTQFSVGIGLGQNQRKNAFEVTNSGNVYIKGIGGYDGTNPSQANSIKDVIAAKQNTLVSGTNIKTINGTSLLGGGDINIGNLELELRAKPEDLTQGDSIETILGFSTRELLRVGKCWYWVEDLDNDGKVRYTVTGFEGSPAGDQDAELFFMGEDSAILVLVDINFQTVKSVKIINISNSYQKPSGGIPSSDLASAVQTSLGKADSAYQKPSTGIPASDIASGVIPTVPSIDSAPTANSTNLVTSGGVKSYVDNNSAPEAVKYVAQSLTAEQKQQARTNIGAGDFSGNPIVNLGTPSTPDGTIVATLANGDTVTIDLNHNHPQYYSKTIETTQPQGGFLPDVVYNLGTLTGTVAFALADAVSGYVNHYFWTFTTSSTAPTVTWPSGITWADGTGPTVTANKYYEISILGGIAAYMEV